MRAKAFLLLCALGGCGGLGSCPETTGGNFVAGNYRVTGNGVALYPAAGIAQKDLALDLQAKAVTIRYVRDGKSVVERWQIKSTTIRNY